MPNGEGPEAVAGEARGETAQSNLLYTHAVSSRTKRNGLPRLLEPQELKTSGRLLLWSCFTYQCGSDGVLLEQLMRRQPSDVKTRSAALEPWQSAAGRGYLQVVSIDQEH